MIPGLGTTPLLIGGGVFVLMFVVVVVGVLWWTDPFGGEPWADFVDAAHKIVDSEDADAISLIPYSDGPMVPKPGVFDKDLMGGKGGYRTPDGDKIYIDGEGSGKYDLEGVPAVLAMDPTEHAAAVDPLKAFAAMRNDVGRWIQIDSVGNVIKAGEALMALEKPEYNGAGDAEFNAEDLNTNALPDHLADEIPELPAEAMDIPKEAVPDGGPYPSEVHEKAATHGTTLADAKAALEEEGILDKIVDISSPKEINIDDETGEVDVEEATLTGISLSAASNLLPKKTNTTSLQVMEEKARQEGRDDDKLLEWAGYGFVAGAASSGVTAVVVALVMGFI
jgi:hypothetical protein